MINLVMAKFLTGNELNTELERLFEDAINQITLISPYIKLHDRYASVLKTKKEDHKLKIIIVFGKNEDDISRSMKQEDFNFFKEFPNIEIRYEKRLHAKYYSNESTAILTSMNLYSYSQDNNIEFGVITQGSLLGNLADNFKYNVIGEDSLDGKATSYFDRVITQSELLFKKEPQYERTMMGLSKRFTSSKVEVDLLSDFFLGKVKYESNKATVNFEKKSVERKEISQFGNTGYCIRTGNSIPFNPELPMCHEAFQSWQQYRNPDYPEKYCHFSGEISNGETSIARPILRRNWKKAREVHGF